MSTSGRGGREAQKTRVTMENSEEDQSWETDHCGGKSVPALMIKQN